MSSSKDYLQFITEQLSGLEEISYRPMMGEYIIYYRGKIVGGGDFRYSRLKNKQNIFEAFDKSFKIL